MDQNFARETVFLRVKVVHSHWERVCVTTERTCSKMLPSQHSGSIMVTTSITSVYTQKTQHKTKLVLFEGIPGVQKKGNLRSREYYQDSFCKKQLNLTRQQDFTFQAQSQRRTQAGKAVHY